MATRIAGRPVPRTQSLQLLQEHYHSTQRAIGQSGTRAITTLWHRTIDPAHFSPTWNDLSPAVTGIVSQHSQMSAVQAAQYYANARVVSGFRAHQPAVRMPSEQYIDSVMGAMGPGQFYHYLGEDYTDEEAASMSLDGLVGAAMRMMLMGGRDTVTDASINDPVAKGWQRIAEAGACDFCLMLAGRGAVYSADTATFQAHDHDTCVAAPVFETGGSESE